MTRVKSVPGAKRLRLLLRLAFVLPAVLRDHFGLRLTPGGLSQALARTASKLQSEYTGLREQLLDVPVLHVDETSWWVAGALHWLWVFTHPLGTFYLVDKSRGRAVLQSVLGDVFPGVLVSDCLSVYDLESGTQQKCYAHHLKAVSQAGELHPETESGFLTGAAKLLKDALALGQARTDLPPSEFQLQIANLEQRADVLLTPSDDLLPAEETVRNRLSRQRDSHMRLEPITAPMPPRASRTYGAPCTFNKVERREGFETLPTRDG